MHALGADGALLGSCTQARCPSLESRNWACVPGPTPALAVLVQFQPKRNSCSTALRRGNAGPHGHPLISVDKDTGSLTPRSAAGGALAESCPLTEAPRLLTLHASPKKRPTQRGCPPQGGSGSRQRTWSLVSCHAAPKLGCSSKELASSPPPPSASPPCLLSGRKHRVCSRHRRRL